MDTDMTTRLQKYQIEVCSIEFGCNLKAGLFDPQFGGSVVRNMAI